MSTFRDMIKTDVKLLFSVQDFCRSNPGFDNFMRSIVSKYPHRDIVLVLYLVSIFALVELGHKHFWLCLINLSVSFLCRKLIAAKRPVEYNRSLMPITDIAAESYGFPSLESHMSVVVFGHIVMSYGTAALLLPACAVIGLIGFSRLYARSRFAHQIIGSWITGIIGLFWGLSLCKTFNFDRMIQKHYVFCILISFGGLLCHFALCAENNDSRLVYLPRSEYIRVLSEIISPAEESKNESSKLEAYDGDDADDGDDAEDSHRVHFLPEDDPQSAPMKKRKVNQNKRDSFFFLQRSLERRSGRIPLHNDNNDTI